MKKSSRLKRALIVLTVIVLALATVCVTAAVSKERVSEIQTQSADHTHVYGNWEINKGATCKSEGLKTRYCTYPGCTAYYTSTIAVTNDAHVYGTWTITKEATCNGVGKKTATCTECGYVATQTIPMEEHTIAEMFDESGNFNSTDWTVTKEPVHGKGLVTQMGYAITDCKICGTTVTESFYYPNNWHVEDPSEDIAIIRETTCVEAGVGMRHCTVCGDTLTVDIPIDPDAHSFSGLPRVDIAPTCQEEGQGVNQCELCDEVVTVTIAKDPDAHIDEEGNFAQWTVEIQAGVHADGREAITCAECGRFTRTLYGTHGLTEDDYTLRANPTCVKPGLKVAYCSRCKENIEKEIPINNSHAYVEGDVIREATCSETGLVEMRCTRCYGHFTYGEIAMIEHTYVTDWKVSPEPTCTTVGTKQNYCVACEKTIYEVVPPDADSHNFDGKEWQDDFVSDNECLKPSTQKNYCVNCQKWITKTLPQHSSYLKVISERAATCSKEGLKTSQCSKCSEVVTEVLPIVENAHSFIGEPAVKEAATCHSKGLGINVCSDCKKEVPVELPIDPDNHTDLSGNAVQWKITKAASGCNNGTKVLNCPGCGANETGIVYSTHGMNMNLFNINVYPKCDTDGKYKSKYPCSKCNQYVYIPIEKGHSGTLMSTVRKADCTHDGLAFYKCSRGNHYYYEIIPATGHTASSEYKITKYPTCTEDGEKQLYCSTCGDAIYPPVTITNGHNMSSWIIDEGKKATCNKSGTRYRYCLICNGNREETSYISSHTYGDWEFPEGYNCASGGTLVRKCTVCNTQLGTHKVSAGVHGSVSEVAIKTCAAHCSSTKNVCNICGQVVKKSGDYWITPESSEIKTCSVCKETYVLGDLKTHSNVIIDGQQGYAATCTVNGLTSGNLCLICGYVTPQQVIEATGHNFQFNENGNKVCTKCGAYKVNDPSGTGTTTCKCFCHDKGTIAKILFKFCNFFWKFLGVNQTCDCGTVHWEK